MTIQKLQSDVEGTPGNMTGADIASSVNGLVDEVDKLHLSNLSSVGKRLTLAATRRIDLVMIGDSNQLKDGYGFTRGMNKVLADRFGEYATSHFVNTGYQGYPEVFGQTIEFSDETETNHINLGYNPQTTVSDITLNKGILLPDDSPIDTTQHIRFWMGYAGFDHGSGSVQLKVRREQSPWTQLGSTKTINTNTGDFGYHIDYIDLEAGSHTEGGPIKGGIAANSNVVAPFTFLWQRAEQINAENGISCHTLYGVGGDSLWDMAEYLNNLTDASLSSFFSETRRLQLSKLLDPIVVVYINSGFNDRNEEGTPTKGPYKYSDSSTREGYIDNMKSVISRIENIWELNGWNKSELSFLLIGSHVMSDPNDAEIKTYRDGLTALCASRENLSTVDLSEHMTFAEAEAANWYVATNETVHLVDEGYNAVSQKIINALVGEE